MQDTKNFPWDFDQVETLKRMWGEGCTASEIKAAFGHQVSRSAVIGKVHRLKLAKRANVVREPRSNVPRRSKPLTPHKPKGERNPPKPEPFDMEDGEGVDVTALVGIMQNRGCKWISGDPLGDHGYCGKPFKSGSASWCPEHHARVFARPHR